MRIFFYFEKKVLYLYIKINKKKEYENRTNFDKER